MELNNNKETPEFNITQLWHKDIFESLQRISDYEKICRDGSHDITEWVNTSPDRLAEIKMQFLRMYVTELDLLISNAQEKINKDFYLRAKMKVKSIKENLDNKSQDILYLHRDDVTHTTEYELLPVYYDILYSLSNLRSALVRALNETLYGASTKKSTGMDKTERLEK